MSCDPGFPDLSTERQRSLCNLLDRVNDRHKKTAELLAAMVEDKSYGAGVIKKAQETRKLYEGLAELICLQFPYRRVERRGTFGPESACTNEDLLSSMKRLDSEIAFLSGTQIQDLRAWFDRGFAMPRLAPLFVTEGNKREAKRIREKLKARREKA
ncbi:hypothetical protein [Allorhodopirellula heiligendammensis]|uniref:Uncharacterized protein n=1 Tax=Allorhodopirellula heiligendammensis TaxID=2714739 RepID=A0A5C6C5X8_9BACT|nr:hypothetical protein [Allorhodopirellula heiligendammensis]TWU19535.1 hypothetical protein Poly21_17090 [Allorhodopirellula heiligendammensis]